MKRFFSLITFLGLLGLGMNLSAQQTQTPSTPDQSGAAQQTAPQAQTQQPVDAQTQSAARSFEGKITKSSGKLVLQEASTQTSYQLDDQDKAKQFEGQSVKVMATMDANNNTLHVVDISPSAK
jgi:type IV secretory pathway TrbF-like protein